MTARKASDDELRDALLKHRTVAAVANNLGMSERQIQTRFRQMGIPGTQANGRQGQFPAVRFAQGRVHLNIANGKIVVFSDAHYWPEYISTAHRALIKLLPQIKPRAVVDGGDSFDGHKISRFPRIGWDRGPTVQEELATVKERLGEVEEAAGTHELYWTLGNHDARYETFLAAAAPQFEGVSGLHLKDHFPLWRPCWSVWVNDNTVIKHRWKGGIHASHNNTIMSGMNMVTGHLHSQKIQPWSDYRGTRYGVDVGCVADAYGPQFEYCEDNPVNWRSGFAVLNYHNGELLTPQLVTVRDEGLVEYLGDLIRV